MKCKSCSSEAVISITAKCSDLFSVTFYGINIEGYVPEGIGVGGGDYIKITYCASCGMNQSDQFPISSQHLDEVFSPEEEEVDDYQDRSYWEYRS
jgi:hypothetical protein